MAGFQAVSVTSFKLTTWDIGRALGAAWNTAFQTFANAGRVPAGGLVASRSATSITEDRPPISMTNFSLHSGLHENFRKSQHKSGSLVALDADQIAW